MSWGRLDSKRVDLHIAFIIDVKLQSMCTRATDMKDFEISYTLSASNLIRSMNLHFPSKKKKRKQKKEKNKNEIFIINFQHKLN